MEGQESEPQLTITSLVEDAQSRLSRQVEELRTEAAHQLRQKIIRSGLLPTPQIDNLRPGDTIHMLNPHGDKNESGLPTMHQYYRYQVWQVEAVNPEKRTVNILAQPENDGPDKLQRKSVPEEDLRFFVEHKGVQALNDAVNSLSE